MRCLLSKFSELLLITTKFVRARMITSRSIPLTLDLIPDVDRSLLQIPAFAGFDKKSILGFQESESL